MNWKKWIKIVAILLGVLIIISSIWLDRLGKQIYGGLTQQVDHTQFHPQNGAFLIEGISILSPEGDQMIPQQSVLIQNGLISAIDSNLVLPPNTTHINGTGKYLIPGLIDAHVHLWQSPNDLLLYLANGITEIRELIGSTEHLKWKQEIENGRIGPKMFVASPRLGSFETMQGWMMEYTQMFLNIQNAEQARATVMKLHTQGYDGLKIYSHLNRESYIALTETAEALGMPYFGHIPFDLELADIYQHGQSDIAHFEELMNALQREFDPGNGQYFGSFYGKEAEFLDYVESRSDDLAKNLIENNISVTSTLWLTESFVRQKYDLKELLTEVELEYENPGISEWVSFIPGGLGFLPEVNRFKVLEGMSEEERVADKKYWDTYGKACTLMAKNMSEKGVKIMAGTDANLPPTVPGFSLHDELISLQKAGMSNVEVLQAATANPAAWLKSNSGKIAPGYEANLVLLDKNPLEDISNTKSIHAVIAKGEVFDRQLLDKILTSVKSANDNSRKVNIDTYSQPSNNLKK